MRAVGIVLLALGFVPIGMALWLLYPAWFVFRGEVTMEQFEVFRQTVFSDVQLAMAVVGSGLLIAGSLLWSQGSRR